jgi:nitrosocyanin
MNKYITLGGAVLLILVGGIIYKSATDNDNCTADMGTDVVVTIISKRLEWRFEPESITVNKCDRVKLTVINEDNFDHGVAIDAFGISQRLPASGTINVNFTASKEGTFPFYCSVSCSDSKSTGNLPNGLVKDGPYTGQARGHFEHIGKFVVEAVEALFN